MNLMGQLLPVRIVNGIEPRVNNFPHVTSQLRRADSGYGTPNTMQII